MVFETQTKVIFRQKEANENNIRLNQRNNNQINKEELL